jgi:uncharacterized protein involved in outer membrane biogenesis
MKTIVKWLFRLLILVIVLLVAFILLLDTMARAFTEREIKRQTGLNVTIGRMEVGLWNPKFHLENFVLYNAPEYGGAPMINLPELHIEYNWRELMAGKLHFTLLRINLAEISVVEGRDGRHNLMDLDARIQASAKARAKAGRKAAAEPEFGGIDTLNLSIGKLKYTSLKNPDTRADFNIDAQHYLVTGIKKEEEISAALQALAKRRGLEMLWEQLFGKNRK